MIVFPGTTHPRHIFKHKFSSESNVGPGPTELRVGDGTQATTSRLFWLAAWLCIHFVFTQKISAQSGCTPQTTVHRVSYFSLCLS